MVNAGLDPAVNEILAQARRAMAADGGGLRVRGLSPDGYLRLELTGACERCARRMLMLDVAIETPLRALATGLRGVELLETRGAG